MLNLAQNQEEMEQQQKLEEIKKKLEQRKKLAEIQERMEQRKIMYNTRNALIVISCVLSVVTIRLLTSRKNNIV